MEQWKDIPGWERHYEASTLGNIRNWRTGRELRPGLNTSGYPTVVLCVGAHRVTSPVHRLIACTWVAGKDSNLCVDHINGNKQDNRVVNLRWCTYTENAANAVKRGVVPGPAYNGRHKLAKLREDCVRDVRLLFAAGLRKVATGRKLRVPSPQVTAITRGYYYKDYGALASHRIPPRHVVEYRAWLR